jgi:hypothetical protein
MKSAVLNERNYQFKLKFINMTKLKNTSETPITADPLLAPVYDFTHFVNEMVKLMMLDNLDEETKIDYMYDWYSLFKDQKHKTVKDFVEWQFPATEVNESTHDFWKRS